jgi:hypothetical protein
LSAAADTSKYEAAIERVKLAAFSDQGYRAQLVNLAETHGGLYRRALDALYEHERATLGEQEAGERRARDDELLANVRESEQRRRLVAEFEHAGELADAALLAETAARALNEHARSKLTSFAAEDPDLRQRLVALANKRGGVYAEALADLQDHPSEGDRTP